MIAPRIYFQFLAKKCVAAALFASAACIILATAFLGFYEGSRTCLLFSGCDPATYTLMANDIRGARTDGQAPDYFLRDMQTRFLVSTFRQSGLKDDQYRGAVAPHGFHYMAATDQVGPQYPPGTPWTLSLFPKDGAIRYLNQASVVILTGVGLVFAGWCAWRGLPFSSVGVGFCASAFLSVYVWIGIASFSINALLVPLFLGTLSAWIARESGQTRWSLLPAFLSGALFGLAQQDRIASALLVPAVVLIFLPGHGRQLISFAVGFMGFGIAPLLVYQKRIAGGYFLPTYDTYDLKQSLSCLKTNLNYYYSVRHYIVSPQAEMGAVFFIAFVALVWKTSQQGNGYWRQWVRDRIGLVLAGPCVVGISVVYFLTHKIPVIYYLIPTVVMASLLLTLLTVSIERDWRRRLKPAYRVPLATLALFLGIAGTVWTVDLDWPDWVAPHNGILHPSPPVTAAFNMPAEMRNPRAWIWSDEYAGSIRLYTGHPAFNLYTCSSANRAVIYKAVAARHEPQYLVMDSLEMSYLLNDMRSKGFEIVRVGNIFDASCFRMDATPIVGLGL